AVQVIHAGAFDLASTGGLGSLTAMGFPALLPVGQRSLGLAQGLLAEFVILAQLLQARLGVFYRQLQRFQPLAVAADVAVQLVQRAGGLVAGLVEAAG